MGGPGFHYDEENLPGVGPSRLPTPTATCDRTTFTLPSSLAELPPGCAIPGDLVIPSSHAFPTIFPFPTDFPTFGGLRTHSTTGASWSTCSAGRCPGRNGRAWSGSTGSQFFFNYKDTELPGEYTPLGWVVKGMEIIDEVAAAGVAGGQGDGTPTKPLEIVSIAFS